MKSNTIKEWQLLTGFVLLAFAYRLFLLRYEYVIPSDGVFYATLGKNLVSGNLKEGLSTYWPPLYPLLIGLSSLLFQDLEFSGMLVSVVAGSLLVIPVYLWSRNSYGKDVAYLSVFLTILSPLLTKYSTKVFTESLYTLLFMTGILTGWSAISKGSKSKFLLTGLLFGLCYLTRPEAIGYLILIIIITLSTRLFSNQLQFKKILLNIFILLVAFIVLSLPYILWIYHETGTWTISEKMGAHFQTTTHIGWKKHWYGLSDNGQTTLGDKLMAGHRLPRNHSVELQSVSTQMPNLTDFIFPRLKALKIEYEEMFPKIFPPLFMLLIGLGLFGTIWSKERAGREIYSLLFIISTFAGYAFFVTNERYLLSPLSPILICWTSKGVIEFVNWFIKTKGNIKSGGFLKNYRLFQALVLVVLILSILHRIIDPMRSEKWDLPYELKEIGRWINNHSDPSPLIMSVSPLAAFYSEGRHIYLPDEEYLLVLKYAMLKKVDYIVIDNRFIPIERPHLKFLLNEENQHPGLELVYYYDEMPNYKAFVFKLVNSTESSELTKE